MSESDNHVELAAEIVSAYVSNNSVPASELPTLLADIHAAIVRVSTGVAAPTPEAAKPAVPPKKSITNDFIVCLEDGRKFKSLKRHLRTQYNMSPSNTGRNGLCRRITRWSPRLMLRRVRRSPSRWASASSAVAARSKRVRASRRDHNSKGRPARSAPFDLGRAAPPREGRGDGRAPHGVSQRPLLAERKQASITRIFAMASSIGYSSGSSPRIARENASPCRVYWSQVANSSTRAPPPTRSAPESTDDPRRPVDRRVERDLNLDPPRGPGDRHALMAGELGARAEGQMTPAWKFQDGARQPVGAEIAGRSRARRRGASARRRRCIARSGSRSSRCRRARRRPAACCGYWRDRAGDR